MKAISKQLLHAFARAEEREFDPASMRAEAA